MAVTQSDIDNLNQAIATGARSVTLGGQTITYNTTQSLTAARNDMRAQLDAQSPDRKRRHRQTLLYQSGKGY